MSVEDRNRALEAFADWTSSLGGKEYARLVRRSLYLDAFLERFSELAPEAWEALIAFAPLAQVDPPTSRTDERTVDAYEASQVRLYDEVFAWSDRYQLGKLEGVALQTLQLYAIAKRSGFPLPTTLSMNQVVDIVTEEGQPAIKVRRFKLQPWADIPFAIGPFSTSWNPLNESPAEFKRRVVDQLTEITESAIERLGPVPTPDDIRVNHNWIEWTILIRGGEQSVYRVAKDAQVTWRSVDKGERAVRKIIGLPPLRPYSRQ